MKTKALHYILSVILTMTISIIEARGQELPVSDTQFSGCTSRTQSNEADGNSTPTIILEKEGDILSVQLLNYDSNCGTDDFEVNSNISEIGDGSPSLSINVTPIIEHGVARCICRFNLSFTVRELESNSFYLTCWWYEGLVELNDGEPLVLEDIRLSATIDHITYALRKTLRNATVQKSDYSGELHIPSELSYEGQDYIVTGIGAEAFTNNTTLTKVTIPQTIKTVDFNILIANPFNGCTALESIEVEDGNPILCAVDGVLFDKEKTRLYAFPPADNRSSYIVPEGVTKIEGGAFAYNQHLVNVSISDEVTSLGHISFYECKQLEEVRLSSNLTALPGWLFGNCEHLKSVTIPDGVTELGISLFSGCTNLTSVTMPESVTSSNYSIFEGCKSLTHVTLSPNLSQIPLKMFLNCSSLTEVQIPESVTEVMSYAFQNCSALKTLDLPESVNKLGYSIFSGCKLDTLFIRGIVDSRWISTFLFDGMGKKTKVFVQPSEVEKYQEVYSGTVYPLPDQTDGIFDIINSQNNPSEWFDLQGRRIIGEPSRGIYIHNGQKRVAK